MDTVTLNDSKRIICPFCGEMVRLNDVLYAGRKCDMFYDPVLSGFYLRLMGKLPDQADGRELYCWREFSPDHIIFEGDTVEGIITPGSDILKEKACCKCHNVLIEELTEKEPVCMIGADELVSAFRKDLQEDPQGLKLHTLVPGGGLEYWNLFGHWTVLYDLEGPNEAEEKRNNAFLQNCGYYVFLLKLDAYCGRGRCIDEEAVETLNHILDRCFHVHMLYKPVIFVLFVSGEEDMNENQLKEIHSSIIYYLENLCQMDYDVCFWNGPIKERITGIHRKMDSVFRK